MERGLSKHNRFVLHSHGTGRRHSVGADAVWAYVITALKQAYLGRFSFVAEALLLTQPNQWPAHAQQQWQQLVLQADHANLYSEIYHPSVLMKRNTGIIAAADLVLAVINKNATTGGTAHTVREAETMRKQVFRIHPAGLV